MKTLTKAEEEVMQVIWKISEGTMGEIYSKIPEPKPAYNTVATIVRILEKKGFVAHKAYGRVFVYYPIINQKEYSRNFLMDFMHKYFDKSLKNLISAFSENDLTLKELKETEEYIKKLIQKKSQND